MISPTPAVTLQLTRFWFWHNLYWLSYLLVKYTHLSLLIPLQQEASFPYLATYTLITVINISVTGWVGARELAQRVHKSSRKTEPKDALVKNFARIEPLR